jgi:large subunit ribosomal protein L10
MPKQYKIDEVQHLTEKLKSVNTFFITEYRGITVKENWELRDKLRAADAEYKVVHNRLMKIALDNVELTSCKEFFVGPVGVVFAKKDSAKAAKAMMEFAKAHEKLVIKAGIMDKALLDPAQIKALASLPPREELLGRLVGALSSPIYRLVRVIQGPVYGFVNVLDQIKKQKEAAGTPAA